MLPIRSLGATNNGLASLILNQASFAVENILAKFLVELIKADKPDVVVGIPTLGLSLAREVSLLLGHKRYIPLGTSRKFWYDERLSVSMSSIGIGRWLVLASSSSSAISSQIPSRIS